MVWRDREVARAMLRNEQPFQALRLKRLYMAEGQLDNPTVAIAFNSDLRCHASLEELSLCDAALDTAAAFGAFVDACIAVRLRTLELAWCHYPPSALPQLTRLIAAGALRELNVCNRDF